MRDNLDLQELRERAEYYRSQSRRIRNRSLIFILGALIILAWLHIQYQNPIGLLYMQTDGEWQVIDTSAPIDIKTDADGNVWIHSLHSRKMTWINNNDWREYWNSDLDDCCFQFEGVFAVYGDTLWVQHDNSLAFFNGSSWLISQNYFPTTNIIDLAVNSQGVYVIDSNNELYIKSHIAEWETMNLSSLTSQTKASPQLLNINDVIYLYSDGLHVFDGEQWNRINEFPTQGRLVGQTDSTIWIQSTLGVLLGYDVQSNDTVFYTVDQLGITSGTTIRNVFDGNQDQLYFATAEAIYELAGDTWSLLDTVDTLYGIQRAEILPDGRLIVASTNLEFANSLGASTYHMVHLLYPILLPVIIFAVIFYVLSNSNRKANAVRTERSRKLISALISDFEVDEKKVADARKSPIGFIVRLVGGFVCAIFVPVFLNNADIPPEISSFVGYIVLLGILFLPYLRKVVNFRDKSEGTQRLRRWGLYLIVITPVILITALCLTAIISLIFPELNNPMVIVFAIYAILWFAFVMYRRRKPSLILPKALRTADYDKAVKDVQRLNIMSIQLINIGAVHMYAGQYEAAKETYLKALRELQASNIVYISAALTGLAHTLDRLGQFEEALRIFEAAIVIMPEGAIPYLELITAYNNNQIYADRALELSHEMLQRIQTTKFQLIVATEGKGIYKLTHALALANTGNFDGVDTLVEEARSEFDWDFIPGRAIFYHMHARILLAMNELDQARTFLKQAIEIDPNGDGGKLAGTFLAQL